MSGVCYVDVFDLGVYQSDNDSFVLQQFGGVARQGSAVVGVCRSAQRRLGDG